jgi:hypothetical protein
MRRSGLSGPDFAAFIRRGEEKGGKTPSPPFFALLALCAEKLVFHRIAAVFAEPELAGQKKVSVFEERYQARAHPNFKALEVSSQQQYNRKNSDFRRRACALYGCALSAQSLQMANLFQ